MSKDLVKATEQAVSYDLVKVENGTPVAVVSHVDELINCLEELKDESIKNDLDTDVVADKIKQSKDALKMFKTYRLGFTNPLKNITTEFTDREKKIQSIISEWEQQKEKMLEETFKIAEEAIKVELNKLLDENQDLGLTIAPFESFIQIQRKVKGMLPSEKTGKLSKASLKKIDEAFEEVAEPIRKAKELEKIKESETKRFDADLNNIDVNSESIETLQSVLLDIAKKAEQVEELYPNTVGYCKNRLRNTYSQVQSNIKALESEAKRIEAEEKAKAEREVDLPLLAKAELIESEIENNAQNKEWLEVQLVVIDKINEALKFKENSKAISDIKERILAKLSLLELIIEKEEGQEDLTTPFDENVVVKEPKIVTETFTVVGTEEDMRALVKFMKDRGMRYE